MRKRGNKILIAALACSLGALISLTAIPPVKAFAQSAVNNGSLWIIPGGLDVVKTITADGGIVVGATGILPITAGVPPLGSGALPFPSIALGTAATNNLVVTPAAFAQATAASIPDPGIAAVTVPLMPAAGGSVTSAGTAVAAGTCQAQTPLTVTGTKTTSAVLVSVPTALPATWQTGIQIVPVVTSNTVTLSLCNGTAGAITPVAQAINVRVIL